MERLMEFSESETQAPDDLTDLEAAYNSPPPLAQECKSYKWKIQLIDAHRNIEDQMLTTKDVWKLQNRKVVVHFDEDSGQPDEDSGGLLGSWLGQLSTDVNLLPINYSDWRTFLPHRKDRAWEIIQAKFWFDNPDTRQGYVMGVLGNRCKDFKLRLWRDYKRNTRTESLANRPPNVPEDQWHDMVFMRFTDKWKTMQERNTVSRRKHTMPHLCGRRSFARRRRQIKNETGKTPCRADFFIMTRKKSDGNFVSDEAKKHADELTILLTQNSSTQVSHNVTACLDDEYSRVFGPERSGRVRCVGRGPTPSKLAKQCTAARSEANNAEVVQMKTKMTSLENQVESLTGIIQQLLNTRSNDPGTRNEDMNHNENSENSHGDNG
ncbi:unnamed protein product [Eruca vesicaria subsp. sativa]|uniref:Transposase, Ptta/En/Spm, plant n=1 Tax=Eruca vesicaria subsp. sativa TaxID=29727 RepID=A0ABC8L2A5_ERUVS|nr:unnamed protein product [Eruca vesicaria subsp. sativa]